MKMLMIITSLLAFTSLSQAANQCAFGEESWELKDALEKSDGPWYNTEKVSLSLPQRLNGLSQPERQLIQEMLNLRNWEDAHDRTTLEKFSAEDGYIYYFSSANQSFAMVASYPGDNEFGAIFYVEKDRKNQLVKATGIAALISDSFFGDCTFQNLR